MDIKQIKQRRDAAWSGKAGWDTLYADAYRYAIPYRRSVERLNSQNLTDGIYDITAPLSSVRFAGQLHQDMFPPGQAWFQCAPGPLATLAFKRRGEEADLERFRRQLEDTSDEIRVHFMTGEFDAAIAETCLDLAAGTGCFLPLAGSRMDSAAVRFVTVPFDEIAFGAGGYGSIGALFWKTRQPAEAIKQMWPNAVFPQGFTEKLNASPYEPVDLYQDYVLQSDGTWHFVPAVDDCEQPLTREICKTRPFASPRYYKVPGELYGRGPLLMSLGAIRTVNRVTELSLKASALQMLGIFGYRPSSTVNPSSLPLAPGAFWPMQSTGGVMGPDVFRMDTGGGHELQVGNIMQDELRSQIRAALHDNSLPESGATPKSATEIMHRVAQLKANHIGSFGRLVHETIPVIVPRVMEILKAKRLLSTNLTVDQFMVQVSCTSPLASAMRSDAVKSMLEYVQIIGMTKGPQAVERQVHLDAMLDQIGIDMGVAARYITTEAERAKYDEAAAAKAAAQMVAESAVNDPKGMAEAAQIASGEGQPPAGRSLQLVA